MNSHDVSCKGQQARHTFSADWHCLHVKLCKTSALKDIFLKQAANSLNFPPRCCWWQFPGHWASPWPACLPPWLTHPPHPARSSPSTASPPHRPQTQTLGSDKGFVSRTWDTVSVLQLYKKFKGRQIVCGRTGETEKSRRFPPRRVLWARGALWRREACAQRVEDCAGLAPPYSMIRWGKKSNTH